MFFLFIAAAVSFVFTFFLGYWTLYSVQEKYPEQVIKQMIAGCWFFGCMTLACLIGAPLMNILEHRTIPDVLLEAPAEDVPAKDVPK
jgi:hypothetical protein